MVNQQLLDYIKQQMAAGTAKDVVQQALVGQGWTAPDIAEAFAALTPAPVVPPAAPVTIQPAPATMAPVQSSISQTAGTSSSHAVTWIIIILLLVLLAAAAVFTAPMLTDFISKTFYPVPMATEVNPYAPVAPAATSTDTTASSTISVSASTTVPVSTSTFPL